METGLIEKEKLMEFWILRFNTYPNALRWLDETPGAAVTQHDSFMDSPPSCCLLISKLFPSYDLTAILAQFPSAYKTKLTIQKGDNIQHHSCRVDGNIRQTVNKLSEIGGVPKNSPCYLEEISTEECLQRLQELRVRTGQQDLSRMDMNTLGNLYRSIYYRY